MLQAGETFFTTVGCMDGRVQEVIAKFGQQRFGAKFPDTITEAGLVGQLSKEQVEQSLLDALKFKIVDVSLGKHHAKGIVVHGHAECAGNPVIDDVHKDDIRKSIDMIKRMINNAVPVIGVFVHRSASNLSTWEVEEISPTLTA